jgi:hypothetical protein
MTRFLRRIVLVTILMTMTMFGLSATAQGSPQGPVGGTSELSATGVKGEAWWEWEDSAVSDIHLNIHDTKCDGKTPEMWLEVYTERHPEGVTEGGLSITNSIGCNSVNSHTGGSFLDVYSTLLGIYISPVTGVRVWVCLKGNDCTRGNFIDNPLT